MKSEKKEAMQKIKRADEIYKLLKEMSTLRDEIPKALETIEERLDKICKNLSLEVFDEVNSLKDVYVV